MASKKRKLATDHVAPAAPHAPPADWPTSYLARVRELEAALAACQAELQRLRERLRTTNAELGHYRELFDFAPLPLLVLNRAGIIEQTNLHAAALLGAPRGHLDGRPLLGHVAPETRATLLEHLRLCRLGELPNRAEIALLGRGDGAPVAVEIHSHCRDRDPDRVFTTLIDLTDHNRAEVERRRAAELEEVAKAQDHLLSLVSHELRTPIAPIANLIEVLQMRTDIPDELRPMLGTMARNVWMEVRLIDDLLDIARIRRDKLTVAKEPLDLHVLLRHVEEMFVDDFRKAGVEMELDHEARSTRLQADPTRISQVFWNLLGNALKFTPAGGRVSVRTLNPAPNVVTVLVEDDGPGIAAADLERLFEPFAQAQDGFNKGLGLGLAIAKAVVESHGGTIEVHSDGPGKGSVFSVTLPLGR